MVMCQWKELECYERNGPITGYSYRIYKDEINYNEGLVDANTTKLIMIHVKAKFFSVAARNQAGLGPHCPKVLVPSFDQGSASFQKSC